MAPTVSAEHKDLLVVQNLKTYFPVRSGVFQRISAWVKAVDDVSFTVREGETFGLVGESGCGKTTVSRSILRLIPTQSGSVFFDGQEVFRLRSHELKALRRHMQIHLALLRCAVEQQRHRCSAKRLGAVVSW